ncbi:MAG: DUF6928 family protein [Cytophagaceae bacterium]
MGWKICSVFIKDAATSTDLEVLNAVYGMNEATKQNEVSYEEAAMPEDGLIYIGRYNNSLIISDLNLLEDIGQKETSRIENLLIKKFPRHEILSCCLLSWNNTYGYSLIKNGVKIRAKYGSADEGLVFETGEPLEEERELYSKSKLNKTGDRIYYFDDFPDEPFSEDQVGENLVFNICARFLGQPLDRADDEFHFEKIFSGYSNDYVKKRLEEIREKFSPEKKTWFQKLFGI